MNDGTVYRHESRAVCKHCGKYPPAPRNWLCGNCSAELRGKYHLSDDRIAQAYAKHQAERKYHKPAMGYTVKRVLPVTGK